MNYLRGFRSTAMALATCSALFAAPVKSEEIAVAAYGLADNSFPFAVAMAKGFFKEAGANVTGILSSGGGGTTIRTMLGGNLPYAEADMAAVIAAIQQGADIKIVADNCGGVSEVFLAAKAGSPINSLADLKGKRIGFTNPKSSTERYAVQILDAAKLSRNDAELVKTGGLGEMMVALEGGLIDVAQIMEPKWSEVKTRYKLIASLADVLPAATEQVAVASSKAISTQPDFVRGVIAGRRKAVDFMRANPEESAALIAPVMNLKTEVVLAALKNLASIDARVGYPRFNSGKFNLESMKKGVKAMQVVGSVTGDPDVTRMIDDRLLPTDLRAAK